jgi:hypothetical protein
MPQPELLIDLAGSRFDHHGNVTDPDLRQSLVELVEALARWTVRIALPKVA